ncbi:MULTISPECIES: methyl-accepting chemotaxis protein [Rhizobium]|uniref:methyl-accepting chemotaxis protein n=1 Tax=Rhizobium TaxID=379 RepID=UPI0009ED66AD|nr:MULTISPECIES: methyl-accepting chemotaxis protein [Rhizobium]MBY3595196.1 hypothetical protein [Rhizobium bangladeshense]TLX04255.1 hypothetical protein FFR93_35680 [Rhizobium sp. MHM7A]
MEQARAGEAGKGFAVVAQEVRDLARLSAEAGQRIKQLSGHSRGEITNGAGVVRETSEVLESISAKVSPHPSRWISSSARAGSGRAA